MSNTILVIGGSGYIGTTLSVYLSLLGYRVIIYDIEPPILPIKLRYVRGNILNTEFLQNVLSSESVDYVVNLAAVSSVVESEKNKEYCYLVNVKGVASLLEALSNSAVKGLVYASSLAVYGQKDDAFVETDSLKPISTYGISKAKAEELIMETTLPYFILRFSNVAGSASHLSVGESFFKHQTHLVPTAVRCAHTKTTLKIYGGNYDTLDGTAVRDYIHVLDVCLSIAKSIVLMDSTYIQATLNISSSIPTTVLEIVQLVQSIVGPFAYEITSARRGDPAYSCADNSKARSVLCWYPLSSSICNIIESTNNWYCRNDKNSVLVH